MNHLHKFLEFDTVKEGEKMLKDAYSIRDSMGGDLYWNICNDDCREISQKLEELKRMKNENL